MIWLIGVLSVVGLVLAFKLAKKPGQGLHQPTIKPPSTTLPALNELVYQEARNNGLRPSLVMAVIDRESRFNPNARGGAGEVGLMQIRQAALDDYNKRNGRNLGLADLFDAKTNLKVGCWYLNWLKSTFALNDRDTLEAYNGGIGNWLKKRISSGAVAYAEDVLKREEKFV